MPELNLVEKVIALEGVELLGTLAPEQLASIALISTEVQCSPGQMILDAAKPVDAVYVILDGSVELSHEGSVLDVARQNAVLGAWALFDASEPMTLSAQALEDVHLLRIARDDFYDLLADNSDITSAIFSTLVKRFRRLVEA